MSGKRKMTGKRKMANGYVSALLGICLILIFVSACAAAGGESGSASETTGETSTQTGEESLPESSAEQKTEPVSIEEGTQPDEAFVKEELLKTLWKWTVGEINGMAPAAEKNDYFEARTYDVDALVRDFSWDDAQYEIHLLYPPEEGDEFILFWRTGHLAGSPDYNMAEQELTGVLEYTYPYDEQDSLIKTVKEDTALRISGQISNEAYDRAGLFLDNTGKYYYYGLWGSVMKVAGSLCLEDTGSIPERFAGRIYMENFDFDSLTGTFFICLDGQPAVRAVVVFENKDCTRYTAETSAVSDASEEDMSQAWLGIKFDLTAERTEE